MKAHLLNGDQDFGLQRPLPWNEEALVKDLSLNTLFNAMARGDPYVLDVARKVISLGFDNDLGAILHRQNVLRDCLKQPAVIRQLYAVAVEAVDEQKKHWLGSLNRHPGYVLGYSIEMMEAYLGMLRTLRKITDSHANNFTSDGWITFFTMVKRELNDDYLAGVQSHLQRLKFRRGVLVSAGLGKGNKGDRYVLRTPPDPKGTWLTRLFAQLPPTYGFTLHPRDDAGFSALGELRDKGISLVADALGQSAEHVRTFFDMLRTELAFYVGCVNLHEELIRKGVPTCFPSPVAAEEHQLSFQELTDACLALSMNESVVGNDAEADRRNLVIITGANQGGKTTFLRSVGLAQSMMQCGMFVSAGAFRSSVCDGLFTHYKREEDTAMKSGKLDEELSRMSEIVAHITSRPIVLFNESFAATNEREGSEIAGQIMAALLDKGARIVCVTHLYELAHGLYDNNTGNVLLLRAERQSGGARTFKLREGEPLRTSFGEDLYNSIFRSETGHHEIKAPEVSAGVP